MDAANLLGGGKNGLSAVTLDYFGPFGELPGELVADGLNAELQEAYQVGFSSQAWDAACLSCCII